MFAALSSICSRVTPAAAYIANMFSRGVSGGTAWEAASMKPPPPSVITSMRSRVARKNLLRCPLREEVLRVEPPHERQVLPELPLEVRRVHARTVSLYRVEHVEPHRNQVGDDGANRAARMVRDPHALRFPHGDDPRKLRTDQLAPAGGTDDHGALTPHVVPRPEPVQGEPGAGLPGNVDGKIRSFLQESAGRLRRTSDVEKRGLHPPDAEHELEKTGGYVTADEPPPLGFQHPVHPRKELVSVSVREFVGVDFLLAGELERGSLDLVEPSLPDPSYPPGIGVSLAFPFVYNPFHGMVVPDPGLPDIVAERIGDGRGGDFQNSSKLPCRFRVVPEPDGDPVGFQAFQRGVDAFSRIQVWFLSMLRQHNARIAWNQAPPRFLLKFPGVMSTLPI
jgi:hypothetical protein